MPIKCGKSGLILLTAMSVIATRVAQAQTGDKAVYLNSTTPAPSQVWIDASAYWISGNAPDLCTIINSDILNTNYIHGYPNGAVIDARGLYLNPAPGPPSIGSIKCTGTPFDYFNSHGISPPPTTILLPATNIPISQTWVLPNNMKIEGEEQDTQISPTTSDMDVIDMGSTNCPMSGCSGIVVEHLHISASSVTGINGIVNNYAQAASYVNDVHLAGIDCAGLVIAAPNSGPYTNINFDAVNGSTHCSGGGQEVTYPLCIDIETQTRGIHGATCVGAASGRPAPPGAAIYVNASNNTIENLHFELFWDGIQIGDVPSGETVANVVVSNAAGGEDNNGSVQNIVHICGQVRPSGSNEALCKSIGIVQDVAVFQSAYYTNSQSGDTSLQDDVTGTSIPSLSVFFSDMYVLGEPISIGSNNVGYSRFSTSPSAVSSSGNMPTAAPTWGVGGGAVTGTCSTLGALYSNTTGGSMTSVYVCTVTGWKPIA